MNRGSNELIYVTLTWSKTGVQTKKAGNEKEEELIYFFKKNIYKELVFMNIRK
jgi:hypothetical protein